jgi:hypothetical protein
MTKKELAEIETRRRILEASLEFGTMFEALRKKFLLSHKQSAELLQEQEQLHFNIAWRRERGRGER